MIQPLPTASASPARQTPRHRKKSADLRRAMRMWRFYRVGCRMLYRMKMAAFLDRSATFAAVLCVLGGLRSMVVRQKQNLKPQRTQRSQRKKKKHAVLL